MHPKGQNFQHTTLLYTEFKRLFVLVCPHSAPTHHREPNAQDKTQKYVLFCHHQLELCASTPLQSICPSIFCFLQALALTTFSCSSGRQHCWFVRRPAASSICYCGHHPPSSDELRLPQGIENLLASKPKCYGARSSIAMLRVPTVGTHSWKRIQRIITNQKQQIKYPCYRIRDTQSLKDKQIHDNVQLPSSRGTMTRTLTLQVIKNRQHDTSRPSVQPNHQDYVSVMLFSIVLWPTNLVNKQPQALDITQQLI